VKKDFDKIISCYDIIYGEIEALKNARFDHTKGTMNWNGGHINVFLSLTPYNKLKRISQKHLDEEGNVDFVKEWTIPFTFTQGSSFRDFPSVLAAFCGELAVALKQGVEKYFDDLPVYQSLSIVGSKFLFEVRSTDDNIELRKLKQAELANLCKFFNLKENELEMEFFVFKKTLKSMPNLDISDGFLACAQVCLAAKLRKCPIPSLEKVLFRCMCVLMDSMSCERFFSAMKLYKTVLQSKLLPGKLSDILTIAINMNDMSVEEYSTSQLFFKAFDLWLTKKDRMLRGMAAFCVNLKRDHVSHLNEFFQHLQVTHKWDNKIIKRK